MSGASTNVATDTVDSDTDDGSTLAGKYLTFRLADEEYGLQILKVREIIGMMSITPVPRTPRYIRGVLNLRGKVIPVVDLRCKFGMEATEDTEETCIIVAEVVVEEEKVQMGILVDTVSEVLDIPEKDIEEAPDFGLGINADFIRGMAKSDGDSDVKILLNIERVLGESGQAELSQLSGSADTQD